MSDSVEPREQLVALSRDIAEFSALVAKRDAFIENQDFDNGMACSVECDIHARRLSESLVSHAYADDADACASDLLDGKISGYMRDVRADLVSYRDVLPLPGGVNNAYTQIETLEFG